MALRRSARTCLGLSRQLSSTAAAHSELLRPFPGTDERPKFARQLSAQELPVAAKPSLWFFLPGPDCRLHRHGNRHIDGRGSPQHLLFFRGLSGQPLPVDDLNSTSENDANSEEVPASGKMDGPSPEDVDREMDNYDKLLEKQQKLSYPPTYQPWGSRLSSAAGTTVSFLVASPAWLLSAIVAPFRKGWWSHQWKHIKEGSKHYWVGAKLLGADIRIASRLMLKLIGGKNLTRREHRQLTRTVADIFRLVPMIVFLVVPFLEFLLPVVVKLFPQMLPSTFEDKLQQQEELKKRLAVKLEVARFLQDTVAVIARDLEKQRTGDTQASATELFQFMKDIRKGKSVENTDILKFAQLFNDELTLDHLERVHLVSMCQFVGLSPFGTDNFLRSRLRGHIGAIRRDDQDIREEGVANMTLEELRHASRARGMRTPYGEGAKAFMERQMEEWLELSLDRALPPSLLLLSRAFTVTLPTVSQTINQKKKEQIQLESLKNTMSTLPEETLEVINMEVLRDEMVNTNATKLEYLKKEEELIREEEAEALALAAAPVDDQAGVDLVPGTEKAQAMAASTTAATIFQVAEAQMVKDALENEVSDEERALKDAEAREAKLKQVLTALTVLASTSGVSNERSKFMSLVKREVDRIQMEMSQKGGASLHFSRGGLTAWRPAEVDEIGADKVSKMLSSRVSKFLHKIEKEMDDVDDQIGENMHIIDLDGDGVISRNELKTALGFLREQLGEPELENLLEELCRAAEKDSQIDVKELMALANERLKMDPSGSEGNQGS